MDFRSPYAHGFARVAACTGPSAIADPPANAEAILRQARALSEEGVAAAVFPELGLSGYSIEDLLLQDAVLDGVEAAVRDRRRRARPTCSRCSPSAPRCGTATGSTTAPSSPTAGGSSAWSPSPTCRPTGSSTSAARSRRATTSAGARSGSAARTSRSAPTCSSRRSDVPGLTVHVEVCEDLWIPIPPSSEAALAGATVLLNLSASPITVGRAEDRALLCRAQSSRCLAAYVYTAAGQGESTTDLSWDGQTMIHENGVLLAETERFPDGDRRSVADVDLDLLRQERARMGTFDDNRRTHADRTEDFRRIPFTLGPPDGDLGLRRRAGALPLRARRPGPARAGLLRGLQHPGRRAAAAARRDRRAEGGHRRLGRPGLHPRADRRGEGDGPRGPAAQRHPRVHAARLRDLGGDEGQRPQADARARDHGAGARHPADRDADARGARPPVRARRGGLRRHVRERPGRPAHGLPVPDRQPARRHRAGHGRPLRARAGLGDVRRRRPDEPLQRQRRDPEDAHPAPDPLGDLVAAVRRRGRTRRCSRSSTRRSARSWCRATSCSRPSRASARTRCRTSRSSTSCATASGRRRSASSRGTRGATPARAPGRPGFPEAKRGAYDAATIRRWLEVFCQRFFAFAQFKRSALPNGPKVVAGGSLSPRGDWRAPSDSSAAAWLADLERLAAGGVGPRRLRPRAKFKQGLRAAHGRRRAGRGDRRGRGDARAPARSHRGRRGRRVRHEPPPGSGNSAATSRRASSSAARCPRASSRRGRGRVEPATLAVH